MITHLQLGQTYNPPYECINTAVKQGMLVFTFHTFHYNHIVNADADVVQLLLPLPSPPWDLLAASFIGNTGNLIL